MLEKPKSFSVLLVDDHRIMCEGLHALFAREPDLKVVGAALTGREAVEMAGDRNPDVVVMDLRMPELNGVDATRQILERNPRVKVVCLSAFADERMTAAMLKAGAKGYVLKDAAFEELATAVRTVCADKLYLSPSILGFVVDEMMRDGEPASIFTLLSPREREVLQLIAEGKSTKEVGMHLHVSAKTVESHRRNLMEKLNMRSIAELTKFAVREGITST